MKPSGEKPQGRSFRWAFWPFLLLLLLGILGPSLFDLHVGIAAICLGVSGLVPFTVQVISGFGLDRTWHAESGRVEHPRRFWLSLLLSFLLAVWFIYGAISIYMHASHAAS